MLRSIPMRARNAGVKRPRGVRSNPEQLPPRLGWYLWLDYLRPGSLWANTARTIPANVEDNVASWYDETTNRAAIDDGVNPLPVRKADHILWAGSENLQFPRSTSIRSVFWVFAERSGATADYRSALGDTDDYMYLRADPLLRYWWNAGFGSPNVHDGVLRVNTVAVNGLLTDAPTVVSVCSLVTTGNTSASTLTLDRGITGRTWDGPIKSVLLYTDVLTLEEVQATEEFLATRHGVAL